MCESLDPARVTPQLKVVRMTLGQLMGYHFKTYIRKLDMKIGGVSNCDELFPT